MKHTAQKPPLYYRAAIKLAKPLYGLFLRLRAKRGSQKRADVSLTDELNMRFARQFPARLNSDKGKPCVWVHAVSLGETNTIAPIIKLLLADGFAVVMTNTTQTGYAQVEKLFAGQVDHSFIPVDDTQQINTFLDHYKPVCAVFVETELWANALHKLAERSIQSVLINARLSDKSFASYQKFAGLSGSMMFNLSAIICQNDTSKHNFEKLGASTQKLHVAPSLKFSVSLPADIKPQVQQLQDDWQLQNRLVMVAASTHEGEEEAVLQAYKSVLSCGENQDANPLLIIVPRHPERFEQVAMLISKFGFDVQSRSQNESILPTTQVYLADSMGELLLWYGLADLAFVGGSLTDIGGHNPVEACLLNAAVIMGPYTQKCQVVVDELAQNNAITQVDDEDELTKVWGGWLVEPDLARVQALRAKEVVEARQDADQVQYQLLKQFLPSETHPS